jgi:iron uptake system component EfeO
VIGEATAQDEDLTALLNQATKDYAAYVDDQITFLLVPVQDLAATIHAGDLAAAQAAYIKARPFYERIEPVAESFPDLDPAIDLRIGDVEQGTVWTGFHPIEQGLFEKQSTEGLGELADQLVVDIKSLQTQAQQLSTATNAGTGGGYQAFEIANGSATLLDEVLASKITGEEEAYSRIDLLDFEANVEGSLQAFATLKPALNQIDPTIVPQISTAFDALTAELATFKDPNSPSGWVAYDHLTDADKKALVDALLVVQEPLSAVAQKITN